MKYVLYKGNVYFTAVNIFTTKDCFVTGSKEKTDDTFYKYLDSYARDFGVDDVYDLYQVDFFVEYDSHTRIVDHKSKIENYEVEIWVEELDFTQRDPIRIPITVDLHDCGKFWAHYVYSVRDGKKLDEREAVQVVMEPEEFKAEMLKHRLANI